MTTSWIAVSSGRCCRTWVWIRVCFFFSSRRRHTRFDCDWSSDVCSSDLVTYEQYETNAEENIRQLHQRLKKGKYQVQPLRRVYIPKEDGKQRPISIPALEEDRKSVV